MRLRKLSLLMTFVLLLAGVLTSCGTTEQKADFTPDYESYQTYAFFGVDSRASEEDWKQDDSTGTEGAPSSDVIMLVRIDEEREDVQVISVYRDTMLDVSGSGELDKCNAAYRNGGAYGAIAMLEENLDLRLSGYVTANFLAVADAIDALGGVDVDVESEALLDAYQDKGSDSIDVINSLIRELNEVYNRDTPYLTEPGMQTLSGIQAVAYSRLRYTRGSDMARAERQRDILSLMFEKMKEADPDTRQHVLQEMFPSIDTDLSESELLKLFDTLMGVDLGKMQGFPYYKSAELLDEYWYMIPCDLQTNVEELHRRVYGEESYEANETVQRINDEIIERSGLSKEDANEKISDAY